jgi:hypothetical protein
VSAADGVAVLARRLREVLPGFTGEEYQRAARELTPVFAEAWDRGRYSHRPTGTGEKNPYRLGVVPGLETEQ